MEQTIFNHIYYKGLIFRGTGAGELVQQWGTCLPERDPSLNPTQILLTQP